MRGHVELRGINLEVGSTGLQKRSGGGADDGTGGRVATSGASGVAPFAPTFGGGRRHGEWGGGRGSAWASVAGTALVSRRSTREMSAEAVAQQVCSSMGYLPYGGFFDMRPLRGLLADGGGERLRAKESRVLGTPAISILVVPILAEHPTVTPSSAGHLFASFGTLRRPQPTT